MITETKFDIECSKCRSFVFSYNNLIDFRNAFKKKFKFIIAYHATNLSNEELDDIKKNGLKFATKDLLLKKAKHRFSERISSKYCKKIEEEIEKYFSEIKLHTQNEINFGLIKNDLVEKQYYYLLFGSEALLPLADILKRKFSYQFRRKLVESGSHYIIKALIPTFEVDDKWIDEIYDYFHESPFAISLVHHHNLSIENIIEIEQLKKPMDKYNMISI